MDFQARGAQNTQKYTDVYSQGVKNIEKQIDFYAWGAKNKQFLIGRPIRANIPLSVDESEVQKGGHFGAERSIDRPRS